MYHFLNRPNPLILVLVPLLTVVCWFNNWNAELLYPTGQVLANFLDELEKMTFQYFSEVLGGIVLIATAFLLAAINAASKITDAQGGLVSIIFLLLAASLDLPFSHPIIWANLTIFFLIYHLLSLSQEANPTRVAFNVGVLLAISSLFSYSTILFIPLVWLGFLIYGVLTVRSIFISTLGFILPYVYTVANRFIFSDQSPVAFWQEQQEVLFRAFESPSYLLSQYVMLSFAIILSVMSGLEFFGNYYKLVIVRRKAFRVLMLFGLFSPLIAWFFPFASKEMLLFSAMPVAFMIARLLTIMRKPWMKSAIMWLLLLIVILIKLESLGFLPIAF